MVHLGNVQLGFSVEAVKKENLVNKERPKVFEDKDSAPGDLRTHVFHHNVGAFLEPIVRQRLFIFQHDRMMLFAVGIKGGQRQPLTYRPNGSIW